MILLVFIATLIIWAFKIKIFRCPLRFRRAKKKVLKKNLHLSSTFDSSTPADSINKNELKYQWNEARTLLSKHHSLSTVLSKHSTFSIKYNSQTEQMKTNFKQMSRKNFANLSNSRISLESQNFEW